MRELIGELMKTLKIGLILAFTALTTGCGGGDTTYSLLQDEASFNQASSTINNKIDVLWIVDNSGSMLSSQQNLAANFPAFINKFSSRAYDFQLAVNTSDAYIAESPLWDSYYNRNPRPVYYGGLEMSLKGRFRDGSGQGFHVLTPSTPDLANKFIANVMVGTNGRGDERSFDSMRATLSSPHNSGFVRQGGHLAVILVTDEDDFSNRSQTAYESYVSQLTPVSDYVSYLDTLTGSSGAGRHYSVNTISVPDLACLNSIYNGAQKVGTRVQQLAQATGGANGSICGDFADELAAIADSIVQLSTRFSLGNKRPIASTIVVRVNGQVVSDWVYDQPTNSIVFVNQYAPPQGSIINVAFDPEAVTF